MIRRERVIVIVILLQALLFFGLHLMRVKAAVHATTQRPIKAAVSASILIGKDADIVGSPLAGYTLIEFGDYQCGPCARAHAAVRLLLDENPDKLRFRFRQFPLKMHQYSRNCSILSEIGRAHGKFWQVHDALYSLQTRVSPESVASALMRIGCSLSNATEDETSSAKHRVEADIRIGREAGVDSTPTFYLCLPDGTVFRLGDVSQVSGIIN